MKRSCFTAIFIIIYAVSYAQPGVINVWDVGIRGDDNAYEELVLDSLIQAIPARSSIVLFFPAGSYLFHKVPGKNAAINITDRSITLRGIPGATVFIVDGGCVGISIIRSAYDIVARVEDVSIRAAWKDEQDGKVANRWSTNAGKDYKYSGINCWAQTILHNVNVSGFSGHGVCLWGDLGVKYSSEPRIVSGTLGTTNGDLTFLTDLPGETTKMTFGTVVEIEGEARRVGGFLGDKIVTIGYVNGKEALAGKHITTKVYNPGIGVIADNCQVYGLNNFDYNGGCGFYQVGADANVNTIIGVSCRENGFWGFYDASFLGGTFIGCHGTANGKNFNDFTVKPAVLNVGSFYTENSTAPTVWLGCYSEGGNQGPSRFAANTEIIGGLHGAGVIGGLYRGSVRSSVSDSDLPVFRTLEQAKMILKKGDKWLTEDGFVRIVR